MKDTVITKIIILYDKGNSYEKVLSKHVQEKFPEFKNVKKIIVSTKAGNALLDKYQIMQLPTILYLNKEEDLVSTEMIGNNI